MFLSGMAAGAASKSGNIGYVVAFPIPEVIRHANAFALGAQVTHPGAKVHLVWTNSWYDPAKEKKAAQSLVSAGRRRARPERRLAGDRAVRRVEGDRLGRVRLERVVVRAEVLADRLGLQLGPVLPEAASRRRWPGTWKSGFYYGSIKDGFTGLAPYGPTVSAKTKAAIAAKMKAIENGIFYEFTGPLYDQSGKLDGQAGREAHRARSSTRMDWLVKGVIGSPKG